MKETRFKDTEIGRIPEDWEIKRLGDFANNISYGVAAEAIPYDGKHKYIRITDISDKNGKFLPMPLTSPSFFSENYFCQENDLLIARTGASVGKSYLYNKEDGCLVYAGFLIKMNLHDCDSLYVYYKLQIEQYRKWIESESMRSGQPGINAKQLQEYAFSIPHSIKEQRRIASVLTSIDNLISSLDKLIDKKKNIKQGAMLQLLTGKTRLKGFDEPWVEKKLGEIGSLSMCKRIFQQETSESGDVPFYKIGTFGQEADAYITEDKFEQFKQTYRFPKKGDILISAAGTIGRTVIYDGEPAYFQDSNIIWLAHDEKWVINTFLFYIYQRINWNTEDTTIARLYNNNFNNTSIYFPHSLAEQQAIATILTDMDNEISALETKKAKYEAIKQGMMQQLLTGKIRLTN